MAKLLFFRQPAPLARREQPQLPDTIELAALYAARRDALDRGDVKQAEEINQLMQDAIDSSE